MTDLDLFQVTMTRDQARLIHGIVMLHLADTLRPKSPELNAKIDNSLLIWREQAKPTPGREFHKEFGKLMGKISVFVDPPALADVWARGESLR